MKAATGTSATNTTVPSNQPRINFPIIRRTAPVHRPPLPSTPRRKYVQHTMETATAKQPPPIQPTKKRSYDTSHLPENDPILKQSGDDAAILDDHDDNSFRVYFQNLNGLKMTNDDEFVVSAVGFLSTFRASVACFAETNVNWKKDEAYNRVLNQMRNCFHSAKLVTSSSGLSS